MNPQRRPAHWVGATRFRHRRPLAGVIAGAVALALTGACSGTTSSDVTAMGDAEPATTSGQATTTVAGATPDVDLDPLKACIDTLSVEEQAGQVLWVMTAVPRNVADAAKAGKIGGVGALEDQGGDIAAQIEELNDGPRVPLTVASDEEGGTVQRLDKVIEPLPAARDTTQQLSTAQTKTMWTKYAESMAGLGFTANFAPVLDVGFGPALKSRSYALDPTVVADFATAAAEGMTDGGIAPIAKHFPGIGYATADPHGQLVTVSELKALKQREFMPFRAAIDAGIPAIMTTHAVIPDVTEGEPVTMSPEGVALLRDDLGFKGLIVTDSLIMGAIADTRTQSEAAVQALVAGNDVALIAGAQNVDTVHAALVAAVGDGTITEKRLAQSVKRVLDFKEVKGSCPAGDTDDDAAKDSPEATGDDPAADGGATTETSVTERDPLGGGQPTDDG